MEETGTSAWMEVALLGGTVTQVTSEAAAGAEQRPHVETVNINATEERSMNAALGDSTNQSSIPHFNSSVEP